MRKSFNRCMSMGWTTVVVAAVVSGAPDVRATIVDLGNSTLDTDTQLLWLDLDVTSRLSYETVSSLLGPAGPYSGYRYATANEVAQFATHAGFPMVPGSSPAGYSWESSSDFARAIGFMQLIGTPGVWYVPQSGNYYSYELLGYVASESVGGPPWYMSLDASGRLPATTQGSARFHVYATTGALSPEFYVGSFLVADVPEPASVALLATGLAVVGRRARKRR